MIRSTHQQGYFSAAINSLNNVDFRSVQQLSTDLLEVYHRDQTIFLCGNGGSGTTANHLAQDLGKSTIVHSNDETIRRLRVISLSENIAYLLAWGNDHNFEAIFVEQLKNLARPGDLLIGFSGSGNSTNILNAVDWANHNQLNTWGITGFDGGELQSLAQQNLHVPSDDMGQIESIHLLVFHWVILDLAEQMRESVLNSSCSMNSVV